MSHTTYVSAVSDSLRSPRWPRQTRGKRSLPAFGVSPVPRRPAASRLQIGLQNRFFDVQLSAFHGRERAHSGLSVHPVTVGPATRDRTGTGGFTDDLA